MDMLQLIYPDHALLWYMLMLIMGLCIGSFLNVVIYRLPVMIANQQQGAKDDGESVLPVAFTLFSPASHCPHCHHALWWRDIIPVMSWLLLRGKSRCCNKSINISYPLVELTAAAFALTGAILLSPGITLSGVLVFVWIVMALSILDSRTLLLPDALTCPLLWAGLLFNLNERFLPVKDAILGVLIGYGVMWFLKHVLSHITQKTCLGGGDVKLTAAISAWVGWQSLPYLLLFSAMGGMFYLFAARLVANRDIRRALPFGPFLAVAGMIQLLNHIC